MKRPYDGRGGGDDYWAEPKRATYEQRDRCEQQFLLPYNLSV